MGTHLLSFRHSGQPGTASLEELVFEPGILVGFPKIFEGGRVEVGPNGTLDVGTTVYVLAAPNPGWSFVGWQAPYEGMPQAFNYVATDQLNFVPIFQREAVEFDAYGLRWTGNGIGINLTAATFEGTTPSDNYTSLIEIVTEHDAPYPWVESIPSGPAVFRWDNNQTAHWSISSLDGVSYRNPNHFSRISPDGWMNLAIPAGEHSLIATRLGRGGEIIPGFLVSVHALGFIFEEAPLLGIYKEGTELTIKLPPEIPMNKVEWSGIPESATIDEQTITFPVNDHVEVLAKIWHPENWFDIQIHHAGKTEWEPTFPGNIQKKLLSIPSRYSDHLKLNPPGEGIIEFSLQTPHNVFLDVRHNGGTITSLSGTDISSRGYILVDGPQDEISWAFKEAGSRPEGYSTNQDNLRFSNLQFIPNLPKNPYVAWLHKFNQLGHLNNQIISLEEDTNKDGINNYLSFLLDENPVEPVVLLGVRPDNKESRTTIWHPKFPEELVDSFIIEYTTDLTKEWRNASQILGTPYPAPENAEITLCDVVKYPEEGRTLFFRIRYTDNIPDLETLLQP
ncbi:MAG: hypothetical protein O3C43_25055 [Verrucomicrobia bacterium]|nr:hypothetical protein [Verrucomicrobiota bacterium]